MKQRKRHHHQHLSPQQPQPGAFALDTPVADDAVVAQIAVDPNAIDAMPADTNAADAVADDASSAAPPVHAAARVEHADMIAPSAVSVGADESAALAEIVAAGEDIEAVSESRLEAEIEPPAPSLGQRLRAAREAQGMTREEVARATHLSTAVIADIEADNFARAGAPIYVRGYLRSYARAVKMPELVVDTAQARTEPETPVLMPSHGARARVDFVSRYWNPFAYAALTAVVIVPVWFLLQPLLVTTTRAPDLSPIDAPRAELLQMPIGAGDSSRSVTQDATPASVGPPESLAGPQTSVRQTPQTPEAAPQRPLMASMTPMPEPVAAAGDARQVTLKLTQASWVEFIGSDGRRLEFALLPAGTSRDYQLAGKADLRIGNVRGATLSVDGRAVDLGQFARGNIAQVTIGDEALAQ